MTALSLRHHLIGLRAARRARLRAALGVWRQRKHLANLDPHLRKDIGLSDGQICREIDRPVWDVPDNWRF